MNSSDAGNLLPNGFYPLFQSHFSKLSVGKNTSANPFFATLSDEPSSRQFSASASFFYRLFIPPFSAETMKGR